MMRIRTKEAIEQFKDRFPGIAVLTDERFRDLFDFGNYVAQLLDCLAFAGGFDSAGQLGIDYRILANAYAAITWSDHKANDIIQSFHEDEVQRMQEKIDEQHAELLRLRRSIRDMKRRKASKNPSNKKGT